MNKGPRECKIRFQEMNYKNPVENAAFVKKKQYWVGLWRLELQSSNLQGTKDYNLRTLKFILLNLSILFHSRMEYNTSTLDILKDICGTKNKLKDIEFNHYLDH